MADNTSNMNGNPAGLSGTTSPGGEFNPPGADREGFSNHPHFEGYERSTAGEASSIGAGFGQVASRYFSTYDRSLRANPYLHIGLAGVGALALGYILGRSTASGSVASVQGMSDIEAAYDE